MRVTGRGDRPLRGGAPAPRTICDTSRKRVLPASAVCASLPSPRGAGGRNERKEEGISMTVHTPIEKLDPADAKVRRELKTLLHPARGRRAAWLGAFLLFILGARSAERRVGEECCSKCR